ncbi:MAG: hypothetical protein FH751_15770 [Firmicutes bacterium]|nr:hypothetical protein [Bacillota bacterium]
MITKVDDIIEVMSEYAPPYLFIGSGFSIRYAEAPDWETLLKSIAQRYDINLGELMLDSRDENNPHKINFPKLGSLLNTVLERKKVRANADFDFRNITAIKEEVVETLLDIHREVDYESEEIKLFKNILSKISGIITTNYDLILEELTKDYDFQSFIGQSSLISKNLVFSDEIYKIHGCVSDRESIILTEEDYNKFHSRQKYILGKLTVIFAEFPLIFIGYSLEDKNIKSILKDLMNSLTYEELKKISEKWLFVEYKKGEEELLLNERRIELENGNVLIFNCIETDNYVELYKKISKINFTLPPQKKIIKYVKKMITEYELKPDGKVFVNATEDIEEMIEAFKEGQQVLLSFGTTREFLNVNYFGLMKDIVCNNNSKYSKETSGFIENYKKTVRGTYYPRYKYFTEEELIENGIDQLSLDNFHINVSRSVDSTYKYSSCITKRLHFWLKEIKEENEVDLEELEEFLKEIFESRNSLEEIKKDYEMKYETDLKKLVTAYDILKYKN